MLRNHYPKMTSLGESKSSSLKNISGVCPDSVEYLELLNEATRILLRRGHWFNTVRKLHGCSYNREIVWPREVGTVLNYTVGRCNMPIWMQYATMMPDDYRSCCDYGASGMGRGVISEDTSPVFNQISCNGGMYIRHYPTVQVDIGKHVTICGIDINGQIVRTERADGTWQDGAELTTAIPFSSTSMRFRKVTKVVLDEMASTSRLYQYDPTNDVLLDMALYQAGERVPNYRVTRMIGCATTGCCNLPITALIKIQFIPVKYDSDIIQIENIDALKLAMQGVKMGEVYEPEENQKFLLLAIREMNAELADKYPFNQIPIRVSTFGTARLSRAGIGMI